MPTVDKPDNSQLPIAETATAESEPGQAGKTPSIPQNVYEAIFRGATEGILVADVETKRFPLANPAICKMLGYAEEELQQLTVADIHPAEALDHVISQFEALARRRITVAQDIPCLKADGTVMYADISTAEITIEARRCSVGFFTDTTGRRHAQKAL